MTNGYTQMTEQELYTHTHYIWHRVLLRVMVMAPIKITEFIALCISGACDGLYQVFDEMLPVYYRQTEVPFNQLSKGEQEAYERVAKSRGVILSQVQKYSTNV